MLYDSYDFESSDTFSEIDVRCLIKDTPFYSHPQNNRNINNNNNNNHYNKYYKTEDMEGIYDTEGFPMTVLDIEEMIKDDDIKIEKDEDSLNNNINQVDMLEAGEVLQTLMVPVIVKTEGDQEEYLSYKSDSEESLASECSARSLSVSSSVSLTEEEDEDEEDSPAEDPKCWPSRVRRQGRRARSDSTEESDQDWEPEEDLPVRKKPAQSGGRRKPGRFGGRREGREGRKAHRAPVPQRRKKGTQKITQWILALLCDPQYNPRVVSWDDEKEGVFFINDTALYAKLWGKRKNNPTMNYEKLSRAMRYYYGNGELNQVDKRTTYQFGSKSDYWRTSKD